MDLSNLYIYHYYYDDITYKYYDNQNIDFVKKFPPWYLVSKTVSIAFPKKSI